MSNWRKCKLSEVAVKFAMGPFGSNIKAENFTNTGVPVIRGTNLNYYRYVDGEFVYLTEEKANQLKSSNCFPGDIVITHRGTLGQVGLIPFGKHDRYVVSQSGMKVTVNPNFLDSNFLLYFFKSNIGQNELLQHESQVGVPSISNPLTSLKSVSLNLPPIEEQKAIASVLSSLDDKIDLLHRQNKTLEAMAETLFRQWFVEKSQQDWAEGKIDNLFTLQRGFDLPSQNRIDGPYAIYAASGYSGGHVEYKVKGPGVTTGRSGLLGKVFFVHEDFWPLNTSLYIKEFKLGSPLFSYFFLRTLDLDAYNAGSAVPTLNRNHVHEESILIPPAELIEQFEQIAYPLFLKIKQNELGIRTLETLRDTLLPKLMSGEVRVDYP